VIWGLVVLLCLAVFPFEHARDHAEAGIAAAQEEYDADLARLPADAPLWDWAPFLQTRNAVKQDEVLGRIRKLGRRQSDAVLMLERGDFPLGFLAQMDLQATSAICDKARVLLRRQVVPLVPATPDVKPYAAVEQPVADVVSAMSWLVGHNCSCEVESLAWEAMAKAYRDTNYDVYELAALRDSKRLGAMLRQESEQRR